jgi:hypothetical protein
MRSRGEETHWIARPPSGDYPMIVTDPSEAAEYRKLGWRVKGPFFHYTQMLPSCVECPECGVEVDTRNYRPRHPLTFWRLRRGPVPARRPRALDG